MVLGLALIGTLLLGLTIGLTVRGCLVLGDRRQLDLTAQRLLAQARIDAATHRTLAAFRQATRDAFRL